MISIAIHTKTESMNTKQRSIAMRRGLACLIYRRLSAVMGFGGRRLAPLLTSPGYASSGTASVMGQLPCLLIDPVELDRGSLSMALA
jgi:hypothetical protein